jgi:hypothetical protein
MPDIKREGNQNSVHHVHTHNCPNCQRSYSCRCYAQPDKTSLVCVDCERGTYDPQIHGGKGQRSEA